MSYAPEIQIDPIDEALARLDRRQIAVESWPPVHHQVAPVGTPVLYVVEPGAAPPDCGELADWIRRPVALAELHARADRLSARYARHLAASATIDENDLLRIGSRVVILSPLESRLLRTLLASTGRIVTRAELTEAVWPWGPPSDPRALDNRIKVTRSRLHGLPLTIHTVRGRGFLLDVRS